MSDKELIIQLNTVLKYKLTAINQLFLHARIFKHKDNLPLADFAYKASIDTMKHSDMLVECILSQDETPDLQTLGGLNIGSSTQSMLTNDLVLCESIIAEFDKAITLAEAAGNKSLTGVLTHIQESQQEQMTFIHKQIKQFTKDCA